MSTLRNFVQSMGGELEVRAVFPDRAVEISTLFVSVRQARQVAHWQEETVIGRGVEGNADVTSNHQIGFSIGVVHQHLAAARIHSHHQAVYPISGIHVAALLQPTHWGWGPRSDELLDAAIGVVECGLDPQPLQITQMRPTLG